MYDAACHMAEAGLDAAQIDSELEALAIKIYEQDIAKNKKMGEYGAEVVPENAGKRRHPHALQRRGAGHLRLGHRSWSNTLCS